MRTGIYDKSQVIETGEQPTWDTRHLNTSVDFYASPLTFLMLLSSLLKMLRVF